VAVAETASISTGIAGRYAQAVFDLAREDGGRGDGALAAIESDLDALDAALAESADLRALIASPVYSRDEQGAAVAAIAQAMGLSPTTRNALGLMARNRRLFVLPQLIAGLRARIAAERGEVTAEVVSAQPLTPEQRDSLARTLSAGEGREVRLSARVDASLIGGLVVRLGSRMIDTSISARLGRLQTMMKDAG